MLFVRLVLFVRAAAVFGQAAVPWQAAFFGQAAVSVSGEALYLGPYNADEMQLLPRLF